jgi:AraC family transcriptional regulator
MRVALLHAKVFPIADGNRKAILRVPANPASPLLAIAAGTPRIVRSSTSLSWEGFLVEKHLSCPGARVAASRDRHVISLLCGHSSRFEYRGAGGRVASYLKPPGTITIMPAGPVPEVRLLTSAELIHCALEKGFVLGVAEEMNPRPAAGPIFRPAIRDTSIQRILTLLMEELEAEAPSGRLYVDSLAHALAARYLLLDDASNVYPESCASALPPRILNRVREKIEANFHSDLSLNSLAQESGYSREHFLRMFRVATGITPHQYILDLRLGHAQEWLRRKGASLIDIAASCGFSSQSHMTSVFRKRLGTTPGEFRRNV